MNWKGWLIAVGLVILLGWTMVENGFCVHGDCLESANAPPC